MLLAQNIFEPYNNNYHALLGTLNRWLTEINKFLVPNQITKGGKIILNQLDNEYSSNTDPGYLKMIKNKFIADGMEVPDIYNDANMLQNFPNGPADIYGWDNYPAGFDCSAPDAWPNNRSTEYMSYHAKTNDHQPAALWEFQGGAFDPWGGPGYEGTIYISTYVYQMRLQIKVCY